MHVGLDSIWSFREYVLSFLVFVESRKCVLVSLDLVLVDVQTLGDLVGSVLLSLWGGERRGEMGGEVVVRALFLVVGDT